MICIKKSKYFILKLSIWLIAVMNFQVNAQQDSTSRSKAMFAGGCFWHLDSSFVQLEGVLDTQVGFTGGKIPYPKYRNVVSGTTGHVEAIQITFDSKLILYEDLLKVFWTAHDPGYPYRKTPGPGAQYQSIIFFYDTHQEQLARELLLSKQDNTQPISTQIQRIKPFYPAESYHQDYFHKKQVNCPVLKRN